MMKNTFKLGGLLAYAFLIFNTANAQENNKDGFYMGLEGSYMETMHNSTLVIEPDYQGLAYETDIISATDRLPIYSATGEGAGLFLGYRLSEGYITVAAEANYTYNFIKNEITPTNTFEQTNEFGAALLPGIWLNDNIVVFGKIGFSQLKTNSNSGPEQFNNSDTGLIYGGGVEVFISDNFSFRGSYSRSTHNHRTNDWVTTYTLVDGVPVPIGTALFEYDFTVKRDKFAGSFVYNF